MRVNKNDSKKNIKEKNMLATSHEIPILRTIRWINKNQIQYLGISSLIA